MSAAFSRQAWLLASVAALGLGAPAYGQDAADNDEDEAQAEDDAPRGAGGDIMVTAERRVTNLQDTPISLVAVTAEIAEAKGIEDLEDLSKFTPNLSITPSRGGGNNTANFVIRGIGGGGGATGERGVGMYIDGIYMPRTSGAVLRVLDIDRIEVLRGPQGTLFGRNSTGGAIRIFSKQPDDEFAGYVRGTYGSRDRTDIMGSVNVPIAEGFAIRAQAAYLKQDGWVQRGTEMLGAREDVVARIQARIEPRDGVRATFGFLYNEGKANGTPTVMTEFDMRPGIEGVIQGNYADWINDSFKLAGQAPLAALNDARIVSGDPFVASSLCYMDDFDPDYDSACNQDLEDEYWQADANIEVDLGETATLTSITGLSRLTHTGTSDYQVLGTEQRRENVESDVFYQEFQINAELLNGAIDLVSGVNYFSEASTAPNFIITRRGTSVFPSAAQQNAVNNPATPQNEAFNLANYANGDRDAGLFRTTDSIISQESESSGFFLSATAHLTDRLNVTGGVRHAIDKKAYTQTRFPGTPGIVALGGITAPPTFSTTAEFTVAPGTTSTTVDAADTFRALDWRATVDYHLTDDIMAYATISKAYKAGSFSYTIASWTAANQATGAAQSRTIKAIPNEEVRNYEAGLRMTLFDVLRLNPTVFRMDYTNRQAAVQVQCNTIGIPASQCPVGFVIQVQNQGDVKLEGLEVDAQLQITRDLSFDGGVAVTNFELINAPTGTVNLFPDVPSPTFNLGANFSPDTPIGRLTLNASYAYVGEQETHPSLGTDSSYTLPAYGILNARVQLRLDSMPLTITAFANNVLDEVYATYAQRFGGGFWDAGGPSTLAAPLRSALSEVRGAPREIGLTLQMDF